MNGSQDQFQPERSLCEPQSLLAALSDVALIDAHACAAAGDMSVSWWHDEVRQGRAPAPAVRKPRCTRWRLADVRAFWIAFAEQGDQDAQAGESMRARLTAASAKAQAKRAVKAKASASAPTV